NPDIVIYQY
nr:Chain C, Reverse transcriptase peptide NPDIVIYQY [Human immunodeficiency virus 1]7SIG_C Chain C, Reverse transcriptase peptide NPDIVIYQY [Human immunodeficiency virus 1]7SIH_C Chain C, Reverse transcriptase peptide NPDIVIYQY [Human immunodeficiency virus 1]